jgi:hypothetical protein
MVWSYFTKFTASLHKVMQMRNLILLLMGLLLTGLCGAQNPTVSFIVSSATCNEGADSIQIAVEIQNPNSNPTSVDINVASGNAVFGSNFTYGPVTVTFPGSSFFDQLITVYVIDDSIPNGDKTVVFGLANPTNGASLGTTNQFTLTMQDIDTPKLNVSPTAISRNENVGTINVPVTLSRGVRDTTKVQVNLVPTGTTAVKGVDFTFNDTTLIWPPDSGGIINALIPLINNGFYERDRTVEVALSSPTNGAVLTDTTFTLTIRANSLYSQAGCSDLFLSQFVQGSGNNQALQIYNPTSVPIDMSVYSILLSTNGGANMTQYNLSGSIAPQAVYVLANPSAEAGITNVANTTSPFINFDGTGAVALLHNADTVDIIGQLHVNPGGSGWAVPGGSTVGHTLIRNYYDHAGDTSWANAGPSWNAFAQDMIDSLGFHNSAPCGSNSPNATVRFLTSTDTLPQISQFWYGLICEVNNPTPDTLEFVVAANPSRSTAVEYYGNDYLYSNQTVFSPPGITYDTITPVEIFPNLEISPTKTVFFQFVNLPSNLIAVPDSTLTLYLTNDNKFVVSFLGAGYSYPKNSGLVEIPLITSTFSNTPSTADVTLSDGNAILGQDFIFSDTTITFPAFSTDTQGAWVTILNNNVYEGNKQINFNLSNATNATYSPVLGITGFTLTIINNDSLAGAISEPETVSSMKIFPNPVANNLMVETNAGLINVEITDIVGNKIASVGNLPMGTSSVNVSSLSSGTYFLNIKMHGKLYCRKFVKIE